MLTPLLSQKWTFATAAHLLNRAGFGGTPEEIEAARRLGLAGAVHALLHPPNEPENISSCPWTTPDDLVAQVDRLWASGRLLAASSFLDVVDNEGADPLRFPLSLRLRRPTQGELGERFEAVRSWIRTLEDASKSARGAGYEIIWDEVNTRQLGRNRLPGDVQVPTRADALTLVGKADQAERFDVLVRLTLERFPALRSWLARRSLTALDHAQDWPRILDCLAWFCAHPRSGLYLRQIDVAGIDSKFIEARKGLFAELLDIVLPATAIDPSANGAKAFGARYGLRGKLAVVRFRVLDERCSLHGLTDLTVPVEQFAALALKVARVFVVENEITGLAFPPLEHSIVVLGLGHAVGLIAGARWLASVDLHYWSDLDTHGFAMLDRFRSHFPQARSLLMDRATLLAHQALWTTEDAPHIGALERLTPDEAAVFSDLRHDRLGRSVRLEQERIGFGWVCRVIEERTSQR